MTKIILGGYWSFQCVVFLLAELALWLVGPPEDGACVSSDCLLNILIENAQDNLDILLPTLQFVEASNDNEFC